jgi:hypothetical protein
VVTSFIYAHTAATVVGTVSLNKSFHTNAVVKKSCNYNFFNITRKRGSAEQKLKTSEIHMNWSNQNPLTN